MTDNSKETQTVESEINEETLSASSTYKILGEFSDDSGAGVLGKNTASFGTPIGVEGTVPNNPDGYGLSTPNNARIQGAIDTTDEWRVNVDDKAALTLTTPDTFVAGSDDDTYQGTGNTVIGHLNEVTADVQSAVIGGGGWYNQTDDSSSKNTVTDHGCTVAGGSNNTAGDGDNDPKSAAGATVGGGGNNTASGVASTVGGGDGNTASEGTATVSGGGGNTASGDSATVSGGFSNTASDLGATVPGGGRGAAEDGYSFVWNDNSKYHTIPNDGVDGLSSSKAVNGEPVTKGRTFSVSAQGGVRFITGGSSVTYISSGSPGWSTTSSRSVKTNIDPVNPNEALAGVEELEIATWEYEEEDGEGVGTTHIGPMAEDFHAAFDVGSSDEHINSVNADGVALAAIQGLSEKLEETKGELDDTHNKLAKKDEQIDELERENDELRDRIEALEAHVGLNETEQASVADD